MKAPTSYGLGVQGWPLLRVRQSPQDDRARDDRGWAPTRPRSEPKRGSVCPQKSCPRPMRVSHEWDPIEDGIKPLGPIKWPWDPPRLPSGIMEHVDMATSRTLMNGAYAFTWTYPLVVDREHHSSPIEGSMVSSTPPLSERMNKGQWKSQEALDRSSPMGKAFGAAPTPRLRASHV